jgi:hypothetical protein
VPGTCQKTTQLAPCRGQPCVKFQDAQHESGSKKEDHASLYAARHSLVARVAPDFLPAHDSATTYREQKVSLG